METAFYVAAALAAVAAGAFAWALFALGRAQRQKALERAQVEQQGRELAQCRGQLAQMERTLAQAQSQQERDQNQLRILNGELSAANEREKAALQQLERQAKEVVEVRGQLQKDFELLANRIFSETQKKLAGSNEEHLASALTPLKEKLEAFNKRVNDINDADIKARAQFKEQIRQLAELNQAMNAEAANLTRALKGDNKAAGNWGEMVLKNLLDSCGLEEGRQYLTQASAQGEDGARYQPDVVVKLPENRSFIIDSKVSLLSYSQYAKAADEQEGQPHLKAFVQSIKAHIDGLSRKDYASLNAFGGTPDYVLMFIPIEYAFHVLVSAQPDIYDYAFSRKIVLVTPSTLLAALKTAQFVWRTQKQNRNVLEIAKLGGSVHDEIVRFLELFNQIGQAIERSHKAFESAKDKLYDAKRNTLLKAAQNLEALGVKANKQLSSLPSPETEPPESDMPE